MLWLLTRPRSRLRLPLSCLHQCRAGHSIARRQMTAEDSMRELQRRVAIASRDPKNAGLSKEALFDAVQANLTKEHANRNGGYISNPIEEIAEMSIPYSLNPFHFRQYSSFSEYFTQFGLNMYARLANAQALYTMALMKAIPGVITEPNWLQRMILWIPSYLSTSKVGKSGTWTLPMRQAALAKYSEVNEALAEMDQKKVAALSSPTALDEFSRRLHRRNFNDEYIWNLHREISPTRIMGMRIAQGHFAEKNPVTGNRFIIQILMRFDTEQSMEVYNRQGEALHAPSSSDPSDTISTSRSSLPIKHRVPAPRKRVIEYWTLSKAMYLHDPASHEGWKFIRQHRPVPGRNVAGVKS